MAASEAGGITQGIGAYKVLVPFDGKPRTCVFLDTPGHEVINDVALVLTFNCLFMEVFFLFFFFKFLCHTFFFEILQTYLKRPLPR